MAMIRLISGQKLFIHDIEHVIVEEPQNEESSDAQWLLRDLTTLKLVPMTLLEIHTLYEGGAIVGKAVVPEYAGKFERVGKTSKTFDEIPENEFENLKWMRMLIVATMDLPCTQTLIESAIDKVWQLDTTKSKPSWRTVMRWKERYLQAGEDISAIRKRKGMKGKWARYPQEVINSVNDAIEEIYMAMPPGTIEQTLSHAIVAVQDENANRTKTMQLKLPTRSLVTRYINSIPEFEKCRARKGRDVANNKFRGVVDPKLPGTILSEVQMDHSTLNVIVLRDEDYAVLGRATLTVALEEATRSVLGAYIGFEGPSYLSAARCLKHALTPKTNLKIDYPEINNEWLPFGKPELLLLDRAFEFIGVSLETACLRLGVRMRFCPRKEPWIKPHIERYFGSMNTGLIHVIPGTTFANILEKADYNPVKDAVMTFSTLKLCIHKWIVDVYHQRPHRGLGGITPAQQWASLISQSDIPLANNLQHLDLIFGTPMKCQLTHKGITYDGMQYASKEMILLRKRFGDVLKVDVRIDEGCINHIYVMSPAGTGEYFEVPAVSRDIYGKDVSRHMHRIHKKYASEKKIPNNPTGWRRAQVEINELIKADIALGKKKSRAHAARYTEAQKYNEMNQKKTSMAHLNLDSFDFDSLEDLTSQPPVFQVTINEPSTRTSPSDGRKNHG